MLHHDVWMNLMNLLHILQLMMVGLHIRERSVLAVHICSKNLVAD